jgi:defect in organelle trafficking protein DotB
MSNRMPTGVIGLWSGAVDPFAHDMKMIESPEHVMRVLCYAAKQGCQDVVFQTGYPIQMNKNGHYSALSCWYFDSNEFFRTAKYIASEGSDIETRLSGGRSFNKAFNARDLSDRDDDNEPRVYRFRINISACAHGAFNGGQMVCRYIPSTPPTCEQIGLEDEIIEQSTPEMGAVILSGPTGSGKTTTFAALLRRVMETDTPIFGNVVTLEEPIEFSFDMIKSGRCLISQSEIPLHFSSFEQGIQEAMRRVPRLIVVGEQRDYNTMAAAQEAANTGHAVYTTVHSNTAALALSRIVGKFPINLRSQAYEMAVATSHMIVSQVLVPKKSGGRMCLREWLVLDDELRTQLLSKGADASSTYFLLKAMESPRYGRRMDQTVRSAFKAGLISEDAAHKVLSRYGFNSNDNLLS